MRVVTGYVEGKPQYRDEGPGYARVSGYGGSAVGHTITHIKYTKPSPVPLREKDRRRKEARRQVVCGVLLARLGEPCARQPGHHDSHRTARYLDSMTVAGRAS